ncbi:MAG: hypothetical protein J0H64_03660 [Actinobacteria bacterium]|nr:hypothetical protein [Actinomycetota bacterium]
MARSRSTARRSALTAGVAGSLVLLLVACAPEPGTVRAGSTPGAEVTAPLTAGSPPAGATETPPPNARRDATGTEPARVEAASAAAAESTVESRTGAVAPKGLLGERLRNTRARFAARFVYVPGSAKFNRLVNRELRTAIAATKRKYSPQAFAPGAGLGDRGCVPGSTRWRAADVLTRSATAPPRKRGTAVTCEVTSVSGSVIQVAMRTVRGSSKRITHDSTTVLYADVASGAAGVVDAKRLSVPGTLWRADAPARLWGRAVSRLGAQRCARGAPISCPRGAENDRGRRSGPLGITWRRRS